MLLTLSIVVLFFIADSPIVHTLIAQIGAYSYFGALITGIFFVSSFTVVPATIVLFHLAQSFTPLFVAMAAGVGSVMGDFLIFRFLKDGVFEELQPLAHALRLTRIIKKLQRPRYRWIALALGSAIIASPLPDEIGIGLLGLSHLKTWQFVCLTYILNTLGLLILIKAIALL